MNSEQPSDNVTPNAAQMILTMQIIAGALMSGVAIFGIIVLVMTTGRESHGTTLAYIAAGFGFLMVVLRFVVPAAIAKSQIEGLARGADQSDTSEMADRMPLLAIYQTQMIIGFALLEGAGFFNLIVYLIEVQVLSLVVTAVVLAIMSMTFPARDRVEYWVGNQLQAINP